MRLPLNIFFRKKTYCCKFLKKSVIISESEDIFTNLAFEDWLYQNYDFTYQQILLLWKNTNCVVIGRHQNPWLEANLKEYDTTILARRNSGGGAVYHDTENLNLTFFSSRKAYDRRHNLEIVKRALQEEWGIHSEINCREDIVCNGFKISGTASKLSSKNAYHHCTVLVDSNKKHLLTTLHETKRNIETKATRSIPTPILNLKELSPTVTIDRLMTIVGLEFLKTVPALKSPDISNIQNEGFCSILPEERCFPGLRVKCEEFKSWKWRYGKTPKFNLKLPVSLQKILSHYSLDETTEIEIEVDAGIITSILLVVPSSFMVFLTNDTINEATVPFIGTKYSENRLMEIEQKVLDFLKNKLDDERLHCIL